MRAVGRQGALLAARPAPMTTENPAMSQKPPVAPPPSPHDLLERLHATTVLLEQIAGDASVVDVLPLDDRERLFQAVARVHHPDHFERRNQRRAAARDRRAAHARQSDAVLHETGIRVLRRKPVFTAPAFFAPESSRTAPPAIRDRARSHNIAMSAKRSTSTFTTSTTSCARLARNSTSANARNWPTCAGASRCSPAGASRSATRPDSSCCAPALT